LGYFKESYDDNYNPQSQRKNFELARFDEGQPLVAEAFEIGYSDAYDHGFQDTLRAIERAWEEIRKEVT